MAHYKSSVSWAGLRKTGAAPPLEASEPAVAAPAADGRDATAKKRKSVRFNIPAKGTNPDYLGLAALGNKVVPDALHCRQRKLKRLRIAWPHWHIQRTALTGVCG